VEGAVDGEGGHVILEREGVRHVGCVQDEIEGECPRLGPILVGGTDEFFGAESECVILLRGTV
jgi:hypothetical protein